MGICITGSTANNRCNKENGLANAGC